jgi:4-amino-4-deoxy-L-arabinose transferase-like glycosyltransferase
MQSRLRSSHVLLPAILLLAVLLRTSGLGSVNFGPDEMFHVYAAKELMEGRPPTLPSGVSYDRALPYTRVLAAVGGLVGLTEWTARLPSVIFGLLTVIAVYVMGRAWYSNAAGLTAAFLVAVMPNAIALSREVRMYAAFQLLYLLAIFLFMRGLEPQPQAEHRQTGGYLGRLTAALNINPFWLIACGVLILAAYEVHRLIVPAMTGPLAYVLCMGVLSIVCNGIPRAKYGLLLGAIALSAAAIVILWPELLREFVRVANYAPTWAAEDITNWRFYFQNLRADYPVIFGTLVLAAYYAFVQKPRVTLFLVCCLGVPLLLHSLVLASKSDRYVSYLLPVMFLIWAPGITALVVFLHSKMVSALARHLRQGHASLLGGVLTTVSVLVALFMTPWFYGSTKAYLLGLPFSTITAHPNWKAALEHVRTHARAGEVVIAPFGLLARYYGPPIPVYHLNENMISDILNHNLKDERGRLLEYTSGAPVISDVGTLRTTLAGHQGAWLVTERSRFHTPTATPVAIRRHVESVCELRPIAAAPDMMIWHCDR